MADDVETDTTTIATKYGIRRIPTKHYIPILGRKIGRVCDTDGSRVRGFYARPLLCWSAQQQQYSLYRDLHSLLRSVRYAKEWEGSSGVDLSDSDHQKLLAWLSQHHNLLAWATNMNERERERFEQICVKLAKDMGQPLDEVKARIQTLTMTVALSDNTQSIELLEEAIGLDEKRIANIEAIANRLNVRAAVVLREIITQQDIMRACYDNLPGLVRRHAQLMGTRNRELHYLAIEDQLRNLSNVKDRPWSGLARRTERDLQLYLAQTTSGDYRSAIDHLKRADASAICHQTIHKVNSVLAYLGLARGRNGRRGDELRALAEGILGHLANLQAGETGILHNNPLPGIAGRARDALDIMRSNEPDLRDVGELLEDMNKMLG